MRAGQARSAAIDWVHRYARPQPGYRGAYFSGSVVGLPDGTELPPTSDVDVHVATTADSHLAKAGKLRHRGALLEISYVPWAELASAEAVLGSYHLAGCFRTDTLIDDPTGRLRTLRAEVAPLYATTPWVRRRCEDARRRVETRLAAIDVSAPFHEQVPAWLFPTGVTCHVLLAAALRNPTIRLRYPAARAVLADYGHLDVYPGLLGLLGCADLSAGRVQHHLDALAGTFDATARVARTPFFFSSDLTPEARPIAIDGSQALIDAGDHREAVFWIVATLARCHTVLAADAPHLAEARLPAFRAAVADLLGIESSGDLVRRAAETVRSLPRLWRTAEAVMAANPEISG
ncbi:hypothetical protein [Streptomyces sp. NPDC001770]